MWCQAWSEHMDCTSKFILNRWSGVSALHCRAIKCEIPQNKQFTPILTGSNDKWQKNKNKLVCTESCDLLGEHWGCSLVDLLHI